MMIFASLECGSSVKLFIGGDSSSGRVVVVVLVVKGVEEVVTIFLDKTQVQTST